jgi:hypothetical protein
MVVLAQPLGPPAGMLKPLSAAVGQWHTEVNEMLREAGVESQRSFDPNFVSTSPARRAGGVAVTTHTREGHRFEDPRAAEIQLRESGVLVLGSRRPVMEAVREGGDEYVFEELIVKHTELLVRFSGVISNKFGFAGSWRFGLVVTGLRGKTSYASHANWPRHSDPYSDDEYAESAAASLEEISSAPQRVVEDLVGPLLRSLNSWTLFPELDEC